jgi:hypothetical protein
MEKLYLITVNWAKTPDTDKIEKVLGPVGIWLRFSSSSWLLWTTRSSQQLYEVLAPVLTKEDSEIIARVDENEWYGFAQPWIWNWIKSHGRSLEP